MRYRSLVLGFTIIVLVFIAGCSSTQPTTPTVTLTAGTPTPYIPTPTITKATSAITYAKLHTMAENWDADADDDGILLDIFFFDRYDKNVLQDSYSLNLPIDIEVWTLKPTNINDQKIFSKSTILIKVSDYNWGKLDTRIVGNEKLRLGFEELKTSIPSTYASRNLGVLIKVHLPDGRTIEVSDRFFIPSSTS